MFWAVYYPMPIGVAVTVAVVTARVALVWALAGIVVPICASCCYTVIAIELL